LQKKCIKELKVEVVETGHIISVEAPEQINSLMIDFLNPWKLEPCEQLWDLSEQSSKAMINGDAGLKPWHKIYII